MNSTQFAVPVTKDNVTVLPATTHLIIVPATGLAELTASFPVSNMGKEITVLSTQTITSLSMSANNIVSLAAALTANAPVAYVFENTTNSWYKVK